MTLIERLEKAGEGSRAIDGALALAFSEAPAWATKHHERQPELWSDGNFGLRAKTWLAPHYSTSLDAALALAERVLPGWSWMVRHYASGHGGPGWTAYVCQPENDTVNSGPVKSTPALALCLAVLRATQEQPDV